MIRKLLTGSLVLMLSLSIAGCGGSDSGTGTDDAAGNGDKATTTSKGEKPDRPKRKPPGPASGDASGQGD